MYFRAGIRTPDRQARNLVARLEYRGFLHITTVLILRHASLIVSNHHQENKMRY